MANSADPDQLASQVQQDKGSNNSKFLYRLSSGNLLLTVVSGIVEISPFAAALLNNEQKNYL